MWRKSDLLQIMSAREASRRCGLGHALSEERMSSKISDADS